jgi:MOSC domain-containing protein YiiM
MDQHSEANFVAGQGIEGSVGWSRTRQVTIISLEAWRAMNKDLGAVVDPAARRANVMVSGVDLAGSRGKVLRLGDVRIVLLGETRPCERMDEAHEGMRAAMDGDWRGGAFGQVLDDGVVSVGDVVQWEAVVAAAGEQPATQVPR